MDDQVDVPGAEDARGQAAELRLGLAQEAAEDGADGGVQHGDDAVAAHRDVAGLDLSGATPKVADFLNESKFDTLANTSVRVLEHGGMMRKGKAGASREDGMTDEIAQQLRDVGSKILRDHAALTWMYGGGAGA